MPQQIQHETLLDGLILVFQDFKALKFCKNFMLPSNVYINRVFPNYYRSSTTFANYKSLIKICFGSHNDIPLDVVVAYRKVRRFGAVSCKILGDSESESDSDGQEDEQEDNDRKDSFGVVRECFINAINYSANEVGSWRFKCCKSYEEIIKKKGCSCYSSRYIEARFGNASRFGTTFLAKFKTLVREKLNNRRIDVVFTLRDVGQNIPFSRTTLILQRYNFKYIKEIIVHCTRDYWVPGYALFWNSTRLKQVHGRPTYQYYPGLLKGQGNFYYEHKHDDADAEVEVKCRKYYNQLFKEVHKFEYQDISPFERPLLQYYLCEKFNLNKSVNYVSWIESVEETLNMYNSLQYLYCREELICSSIKPSSCRIDDILNFMRNRLIKGSSQSFIAVKKNQVSNYFNGFVPQLLECIKNEIVRKTFMEDAQKLYFIKDDQLRLVCSCEAVIAFVIYGTANSRRRRAMYRKEIQEDLGILDKNFKNSANTSSRWRSMCVGLSGLKNIRINSDNEVVCTATFVLNRMFTLYLSTDSRELLNDYFEKCNDPSMCEVILNGVSDILLNFIVTFSFNESNFSTAEIQNWNLMRNYCLKFNAVIPVTPKEYCDWLFKIDTYYYNDIIQVIEQCKNVFPVCVFNRISDILCTKIESKIREKCCMLIAPKDKHTKFAVLPIAPPPNSTLSEVDYYSHQYLVLTNVKVLLKESFPALYKEDKIENLILKKLQNCVQSAGDTLEKFVVAIAEELS